MKDTLRTLFSRRTLLAQAPHRASRIQTNEGPRGYSIRASVYLRHVAYVLAIALCSAVTHVALDAAGPYSLDGGMFMFFMATLMFASGALASIAYANQRNELLEQLRQYVFGMMVFPGTAIALVMWGLHDLVTREATQDALMNAFDNGLVLAFGAALLIPPVMYVKMIAGIRTIHRSTRDDQEMMQVWSRQDGHQT